MPDSNDLKPDPLVERRQPDPSKAPASAAVLEGHLGRSLAPGHVRLYLSPALDEYVEVPEADILDREIVGSGDNAHSRLTVRSASALTHVRMSRVEAQFLSGEVTSTALAGSRPGQVLAGGKFEPIASRNDPCYSAVDIVCPSKVSDFTPFGPECTLNVTCVRKLIVHQTEDET
jgi:hypothetical protein